MSAPPRHVFVLSYASPLPGGSWTVAFIGVYSSLEQAELAKARIGRQIGFRDYPEGFRIDCFRLDEDYDDPQLMTLGPPPDWTGPGDPPNISGPPPAGPPPGVE